jgi:hypothetical protein
MLRMKVMNSDEQPCRSLDTSPDERLPAEVTCGPIALGRSLAEPGSTRSRMWTIRLTWGFVALGLLVRLVRYWVRYPLWPDEAFVAVNFLDRDYAGLLKPLAFSQVCPPLFLWIELTAVRLLGFAEWTLRLWPMLCGLASVIVFRLLAGRLLGGLSLLLAVAIFSTAASPIRHCAEVKPYESDLLAALVLLTLAVEWWRSPEQTRYWWILAIVLPILLAVSNPAILVAAGVSLALLPVVVATKKRSLIVAFCVYNLSMVGAFGCLYLAFTAPHSAAVRWVYRWNYWRAAFPPWDQLWNLPLWLLETHTGNMLAYPIGGRNGASTLTAAFLFAGIAVLWRMGRRRTIWLLLSPFAAGLAAAILGQYPYGQATRITLYQAPSICILTGLGIAALVRRFSSEARQRRYAVFAVGALFALGAYSIGADLLHPYRAREDAVTRQFARWLWLEHGRDADLFCAAADLGLDSLPKYRMTNASAIYPCYRRIFLPSSARRPSQGKLDLVSAASAPGRTVRLAFVDEVPEDNPRCMQWLASMSARYDIGPPSVFVVHAGSPTCERERYVVLELVPKGARQIALGRAKLSPDAATADGRGTARR